MPPPNAAIDDSGHITHANVAAQDLLVYTEKALYGLAIEAHFALLYGLLRSIPTYVYLKALAFQVQCECKLSLLESYRNTAPRDSHY